MNTVRPRLVFISPVFLFPNDAGGKIRTTNILRGLKGGAFHVTLLSVASSEQQQKWAAEIDGVCDEFVAWEPTAARPKWLRAFDLSAELPINVMADRTRPGVDAVAAIAARADVDLMVFDFVHSSVLRPDNLTHPSVCFTHNVEAEIFGRHASQAKDPMRRWMWTSQFAKMRKFEHEALRAFDSVVAVSDRDARFFTESYGVAEAHAIPTGVDLDFFSYQQPPAVSNDTPPTVMFTGSMDWAANIDGIQFFLGQVWPKVIAGCPEARFQIVGRNPPAALRALALSQKNVEFTGFVDDVRTYVHKAHAFVIPLLVGGGTRIKAFEAMAMGCPVVSTAIGIEGLGAEQDVHYLERDDPASMADAVLALLADAQLRNGLAQRARALVQDQFGHEKAARVFEQICLNTLKTPAGSAPLAAVKSAAVA